MVVINFCCCLNDTLIEIKLCIRCWLCVVCKSLYLLPCLVCRFMLCHYHTSFSQRFLECALFGFAICLLHSQWVWCHKNDGDIEYKRLRWVYGVRGLKVRWSTSWQGRLLYFQPWWGYPLFSILTRLIWSRWLPVIFAFIFVENAFACFM